MLLQKLLPFFVQIVLLLQLGASAKVELDVDELKLQISSHLSYTARRLALIQKNVNVEYTNELAQLLARYLTATNVEDPLVAERELLAYEDEQREEFIAYLHLQYDEQFLNEDIRIQEWSMRQLLPQVSSEMAAEIEKILPGYERAVKMADFDEKYAAFTGIQEEFSAALWQLIDAEPEDIAVLNVQLQFFKEFILYLQKQEDALSFASALKQTLAEVETALLSVDLKQKVEVLDSFDDLTTKFKRYLDYKILEFQFDRFGQ
ncbi:uncharacterized protein LOC101463549 [Ceratitis capitata]|uniref:uncharacterized protein LOC101463549 n=1 Tax=Ceratitis capitata TaxID=7213 RepID=UPI00032A23F1|nr:uncharacterized protein LOC101463549 [Ceratitis capitata]